ncbi:hypothetical protein PTT_13917 [Pyrenophora teres f. teres 0-1]|uniref:Uncharacterized protein n=1 Tax=Pyrenophora teres f. teres (strain 0-1) TaxID=861557 RepID=E3RX34_PYRTT|nr:hypothetical protein PTT_13917 [Pyrenophora teres f. teres 0-1]
MPFSPIAPATSTLRVSVTCVVYARLRPQHQLFIHLRVVLGLNEESLQSYVTLSYLVKLLYRYR